VPLIYGSCGTFQISGEPTLQSERFS
jgi:hypothetical protein